MLGAIVGDLAAWTYENDILNLFLFIRIKHIPGCFIEGHISKGGID